MNNDFDYKNFYRILEISNSKEKEILLKELIDNYLGKHFYAEDRRWFNELIGKGLINLVYHCERTIPYFSLYDNNKPVEHFSNISFLWAIRSGNLEMVQYFMNHEDFPKFCKKEKLEEEIAKFLDYYRDDCTRKDILNLKNYELLIDLLVEKFPWSIPPILAKVILGHEDDLITPVLKSFIKKYHPYLKDYLYNQEVENNFTRLCMVSLNHNCLEFGGFLKEQYPDIPMYPEFVSFYLLYQHNPFVLQWMIENPQFFDLKKINFDNLYEKAFCNILQNKVEKKDYEFFFMATKAGLHKVTFNEFEKAINTNLTPFVKKYYKEFRTHNFDVSSMFENTCVRYIDRQQKEKQYKDLLVKFPAKHIHTKKMKI